MIEKVIIFIHGRPSPHPLHKSFGESVGANFILVDRILRWHDKESFAIKRYLSWLLNALFLPKRNKAHVFITEGPHFVAGVLKWLNLIGKKQITIALLDNETLYFIDKNIYSTRTKNALIKLIKSYDAIISPGNMEFELAKKYSGSNAIVKKIFNGINDQRLENLLKIKPEFDNTNIVFIGNVGADWRAYYKGVDMMLQSFEIAFKTNNQLKLFIIGDWDKHHFVETIEKHAPLSKKAITKVGYTKEIDAYLTNASLYLHTARGESWGISVTEAMAAGIMPIVSVDTGSKEVVEKVDSSYVVSLSKESIAGKIIEHFNESKSKLNHYSLRCKEVASYYSETNAINAFKNAFSEIVSELS
ncbi:MAG: glycosyltransferase [Bacteroidia bacterium]|nr:glycosyltransferase [Bacteroidia bacterium]